MASSPQSQFSWNWQNSQVTEPELTKQHIMNNVSFLPLSSPVLGSPTLGSPSQRKREEDTLQSLSPHLGIQKKNKMKAKVAGSPATPRTLKKIDEEKLAKRIRESYACLRHRAMHKRCPAECPERRIPKPLPVAQERWQVQQQVSQQRSKHLDVVSSPVMSISSPNTMRVLQDFQNAHISSPQIPTHRRDSVDVPPSFASIYSKGDTNNPLWDQQLGLSSSWGPGEWSDETWQDLASSSSGRWDSGESQDDSSPTNDMDNWFVGEGTPNPIGFTDEELSAVAQSIDSTNQILYDLSPEEHVSPITLLFKILLSRDQIERWITDDLFGKSLRGFYVRVRIAEVNGVYIHRIGCILEARSNCFKQQSFNDSGMGIVVHFGSSGQHIVSICSISNSPPDETECNDWLIDAEKNHISIMPEEVVEKQQLLRHMNAKNTVVYSSH